MMYEMQKPADFNKALYVSYPYMWLVYLIVAGMGYHFYGAHAPAYLPDVLPYNDMRTIANAFLLAHMLVSYVLKQQIFNRWLFEFVNHHHVIYF